MYQVAYAQVLTFVPLAYIPPRLREGAKRWLILDKEILRRANSLFSF
jgi:hypothetical protein